MSKLEAFLARTHVPACGGCWLWEGVRLPTGYGSLSRRIDGRPSTVGAHRLAWELFVGPIPADRQIDHLCQNRQCVRPDHLRVVTQQENANSAGVQIDPCDIRQERFYGPFAPYMHSPYAWCQIVADRRRRSLAAGRRKKEAAA